MRAPAMGLSLLALVSAGSSVDVQCSGTGCGAELIADGWTKIAECGGHSWSYLLAKGSDVVVCTGIAAYGGYVEFPCQAFEGDIAQYRLKRACTP
jgi:hypothetical protein